MLEAFYVIMKAVSIMKSTQKKAFSRILGLLLMITLVIAIIPAIPGEAASKKSKAIAAYKKILSQSTVAVVPKKVRSRRRIRTYAPAKAKNVRYSVAYIDNDSIPELILVDSSKGFFGIWTFKNGKMMNLDFFLYDNPVGFYKKKGVFKTSHKSGNDFYIITNGKSKEILFISKDKGKSSKQYYSYIPKEGSKKISKSKFNKKLRGYVSSTKLTRFKMHKNTKSNRKKYLPVSGSGSSSKSGSSSGSGSNRSSESSTERECQQCRGTGICPICDGKGLNTSGDPKYWSKCLSCNGDGECHYCGGDGVKDN